MQGNVGAFGPILTFVLPAPGGLKAGFQRAMAGLHLSSRKQEAMAPASMSGSGLLDHHSSSVCHPVNTAVRRLPVYSQHAIMEAGKAEEVQQQDVGAWRSESPGLPGTGEFHCMYTGVCVCELPLYILYACVALMYAGDSIMILLSVGLCQACCRMLCMHFPLSTVLT